MTDLPGWGNIVVSQLEEFIGEFRGMPVRLRKAAFSSLLQAAYVLVKLQLRSRWEGSSSDVPNGYIYTYYLCWRFLETKYLIIDWGYKLIESKFKYPWNTYYMAGL